MDRFKVLFKPDSKEIEADRGEILLSCAIKAGIYINSSCGGDGVCGRCKVIIENGSYRTEPTGRITHEERKKGYVLACLTTIQGDLIVKVPASSRLDIKKIKEEIYQGRISMGHAKAILMLESEQAQLELCNKIIKRGLSVREAEYFVKRKMKGSSYGRPRKHSTEIRAVEEELQRMLGTRVTLLHQSKRGKIIIEYYSNDDLERLLNLFRGRARSK